MKNKIIKLIIFLAVVIGCSVGFYFLFKALGVTSVSTLRDVLARVGVWSWVVFLALQVVITTLLAFAPGGSMTFISLGVLCFGANWKTFLLCFSGVIISSVLMDLLGRFGGARVVVRLVGKKDYEEAVELIKVKGEVYLPIMYLLPLFPDDALCLVAGMSKINFWLHLAYIVVCRGIGVATIVFGVSLLPEEVTSFTSSRPWDYIEVATILLAWVYVLLRVARVIDKKLSERRRKKDVVDDVDLTNRG